MSESRKNTDWLAVTVCAAALLIVSLSFYAGGYYATSELGAQSLVTVEGETTVVDVRYQRRFKHRWLRNLYWPAAKVEALIRGEDIHEYDMEKCEESGYEFSP